MSRWLFKCERRMMWERRRRWAIAALTAYLVLYWMDGAIYRRLYAAAGLKGDGARAVRDHFELRPLAGMLKSAGYFPAWLVVGAVLAAAGRVADGVRIAAAAGLGGLLADALKPIVGQVRPHLANGEHWYRHAPGVAAADLSYGMASSHAGVAFGAAWMMVFLYGRPGWVALALAAACGAERVMVGAHFATDIYVGALLGYAGARVLRPGGWGGARQGLVLP